MPMEYPFSPGMISTPSTILPLISGNAFLLRLRRECVTLETAMGRLSSEGDLWSGAGQRSRAGLSCFCLYLRKREKCKGKAQAGEGNFGIVCQVACLVSELSCLVMNYPVW